MKEANPTSIRFGISLLWDLVTAPVFYSTRCRQSIIVRKFLFILLGGNYFYYIIFKPTVLQGDKGFIRMHFFYYPTQITFRTVIGKRKLREYIKYKRGIAWRVKPYVDKYTNSKALDFKTPLYFYQRYYKIKKFQKEKIRLKYKYYCRNYYRRQLRLMSTIGLWNKNFQIWKKINVPRIQFFLFKNNRVNNKLKFYFNNKKKVCKYLKIIRARLNIVQLKTNVSAVISQIFGSIIKLRISVTPIAKLFLVHSKLITCVYIIYNKFPYYHNTVCFLDSVFTSTLALQFRDVRLIVTFICRELERTRIHFKFLSILRQIVTYYHQETTVIDGIGFKLLLRGPVNGHSRTKRIKIEFNPAVQKMVFKKSIFFWNFYSNTIFGTVGVRLWLG